MEAWAARAGGLGRWEALAVGFGLNARGAMELVIAAIGLSIGILNEATYATIVLIAVLTSLMAAPMLKICMDRADVVPVDPPWMRPFPFRSERRPSHEPRLDPPSSAPTAVEGAKMIAYVLLDDFLIVVLARILGGLMTKIGQPRVVGEILAGVVLGPTLLGADLSFFIAPVEVRPVIAAIATIALIMFMFLAGVEYDISVVAGRGTRPACWR